MSRPRRIVVFGSSTVRPGDPAYTLGLELGRAIALAGAEVATGGYSGTMEAVSRGAHEAGGHVVGVTVDLFEPRGPANRWVRERVHTPHLYERLKRLVEDGDGFVVLPGSLGTLTELFLAWTLVSVDGRPRAPIVLLGQHWPAFLEALRQPDMVLPGLFEHVEVAAGAEDAARLALGEAVTTRAAAGAPRDADANRDAGASPGALEAAAASDTHAGAGDATRSGVTTAATGTAAEGGAR